MNLFLQLLLSYLFAHFCLLCFCFLFLLSLLSVVLIVFHIPLYSPTSLLVWKSWCAAQSCPTLYDPMNCSLPGSSVHGILQAGILKWVAISFSRGSSWPRDCTWVSCIVEGVFTIWATREAHKLVVDLKILTLIINYKIFYHTLFSSSSIFPSSTMASHMLPTHWALHSTIL